jgi:hypothetical protein
MGDINAVRIALKLILEVSKDGRFIAYNNGTVLDTKTKLIWAAKDNGSSITWQNAKQYCENYTGGGYTDWRMPTKNELAGIEDGSKSREVECIGGGLNVVTELIDISCPGVWASDSVSAFFWLYTGARNWFRQKLVDNYGMGRALPVRSAK